MLKWSLKNTFLTAFSQHPPDNDVKHCYVITSKGQKWLLRSRDQSTLYDTLQDALSACETLENERTQ